jgi:hypothetical protein
MLNRKEERKFTLLNFYYTLATNQSVSCILREIYELSIVKYDFMDTWKITGKSWDTLSNTTNYLK